MGKEGERGRKKGERGHRKREGGRAKDSGERGGRGQRVAPNEGRRGRDSVRRAWGVRGGESGGQSNKEVESTEKETQVTSTK